MFALVMTLSGLALVESLNVLNLGATSAIVYDSRLHRRSPLPGGLSFIAGLFAATAALGVAVVLGVDVMITVSPFELTPALRYWSELIVGALLICVACYPAAARRSSPQSTFTAARRRPWLLACAGSALGFGQAATDVVYLGAMAMLSTHHPRPWFWPLLVVAYCAIELFPPALILMLATRRTPRAQRVQRRVTRIVTRYGPRVVRAMCAAAGAVLVVDALRHHHYLW